MKNKTKNEKGMRYPALNELISKAHNKYELVLATAKRARELVDGAEALTEIVVDNPISIATKEIAEGAIELENPSFDKVEAQVTHVQHAKIAETAPLEVDIDEESDLLDSDEIEVTELEQVQEEEALEENESDQGDTLD